MKINFTLRYWGIYSVWRQNAKVFQNTWLINFLPPITEPSIYLVSFGLGLMPLVGDVSYLGKPVGYLQFIAPGMIAIGALSQSFVEATYGTYVRVNLEKIWQATLTAPISFTEVFLGDLVWAATRGFITSLITGLVTVLAGLYSGWNLILSLPLLCLGSFVFAAIGMFVAGMARTVDQLSVPFYLFIVPMFVLGGTFFPRETLPPWLATITGLFPLTALTELLRWPLGLRDYWFWQFLWIVFLMGFFAVLGWRKIYPLLFK